MLAADSIFDMAKYMVDEEFAAPIFMEFLDTKNGIPATLECVTESQIDSALVELQPLSK